ncbi:membrane protein [Luedemannella flava]|uniref:Membrane protein n=1 Tax=Luedemannella flava TaxID=349316 RepID=A0ABN2MA10_9ACTN
MWWVVAVVTAVVLVATYVTWTAGRVDRLHARAAAAYSALDAQLVRRAATAVELGERAGLADLPPTAKAAITARADERELAENDLTHALREVRPAADAPEEIHESLRAAAAASRRVALARQVHSDLVRDARAIRRRPMVRVLRLCRHHPEPHFFDIDDPTLELSD